MWRRVAWEKSPTGDARTGDQHENGGRGNAKSRLHMGEGGVHYHMLHGRP